MKEDAEREEISESASRSSSEVVVIHDFDVNHNRRPKVLMQTAGSLLFCSSHFSDHHLLMQHFSASLTHRQLSFSLPPFFPSIKTGHVSGAAFYYRKGEIMKDQKHLNRLSQDGKKGERDDAAAGETLADGDVVTSESKSLLSGVSIHPKFGGWFAFRAVLIFPSIRVPELKRREPPDLIPSQAKREQLLYSFFHSWESGEYRNIIPPITKYSDRQKKYFETKPSDRISLLISFVREDFSSRQFILGH